MGFSGCPTTMCCLDAKSKEMIKFPKNNKALYGVPRITKADLGSTFRLLKNKLKAERTVGSKKAFSMTYQEKSCIRGDNVYKN